MVGAGFLSTDAAERAVREPLGIAQRALESEAPYFVDYISQGAAVEPPAGTVDVYTTLDVHLQRVARRAARRDHAARRDPGPPEAAAAGGADRRRSPHRRSAGVRRGPVLQPVVAQPRRVGPAAAGLGVQAVRVSRGVSSTRRPRAAPISRRRRSCSTSRRRSCSTRRPGPRATTRTKPTVPSPLRRALALVAQHRRSEAGRVGRDTRKWLRWRRVGAGTPPRPYPAIALGVFEATPFDIATAYTLFPNGGTIRPLTAISRLVAKGKDLPLQVEKPRTVARPTRPSWSRT